MASKKVLQEWCRVTCASYPGVEIRDLSTSFRDGLAFCAIIHKHRPDLIDFRSLSKDNAYENNKLAFQIADTKLGIPALLHPMDMLSSKQPDYLSVLTYLSLYYDFFSRKTCVNPSKLGSSHVGVSSNKSSDGPTHVKSLTDGETAEENRLVSARPRTVCHLCFKPVHLIQRRLVDGKVFHRSCFRCKVCSCSLLPDSYTQGSDPSSLVCSYHVTNSPHLQLNQGFASPNTEEGGYYSLAGLAISAVPHYTETTESRDRPVCGTAEPHRAAMNEISRVNRSPPAGSPHLPQDGEKDRTVKESDNNGKASRGSTETSEVCSVRAAESRPVPAPRRSLDSTAVPVPAVRVRTSQTTNSLPPAESSTGHSKSLPASSHMNQQTATSQKIKLNHPWKVILHPGPWTQLPPAPPPVPPPRSKRQTQSLRPAISPHNPFEEEEKEEADLVSSIQTNSSASSDPKDKHEDSGTAIYATVNKNRLYPVIPSSDSEEKEVKPPSKPSCCSAEAAGAAGGPGEALSLDTSEAAAGVHPTFKEAQKDVFPRSVSVPAITSDHCPSESVSLSEERQCATSCQPKVCRENPFDLNPGMTKSKTLQALPSSRSRAPGHGFPLIKRKVQTDPWLSAEDVETQMRELDKRVVALERRGLELERKLRDCRNDTEQEHMLAEWFSIIHERQILFRRDAELVYQLKQQKLEDRHADVEFELRCLLIKPESDWTERDRDREQQLMDELVAVIEQRNRIVSCLELDRQREKTEDLLFEENMKGKEFPKEKRMEQKKSVGKLRPKKVFKLLSYKSESHKKS